MNGTPRCRRPCSRSRWRTIPTARSTTRSPARSETMAATAASMSSRATAAKACCISPPPTSTGPPAQRGDLAITTEGDGVEHVDYHVRGQWFDSLSRYWREFAKAGPADGAPLRRTARDGADVAAAGARHARTAHPRRARRAGACALRHHLELSARRRSTGSTARSPAILNMPAIRRHGRNYYATQWADSRASGAEALQPMGRARGGDLRLSRFACSAPRIRPRSSTRYPGTLGVLRSATVIRLEGGELWGWEGQHIGEGSCEGQLHACVELPAGARLALSGARADAARDRVRLQSAAERRPHLPPASAARLRLRHHRSLRRRAFRRDDQGLSRMAQFGRRCMASPLLAQHQNGRSNTPGRRKIPTAGIRRRRACCGASSTIRSTWSCSAQIPG